MIDKKLITQTANNMLEKGSIEGSIIEYKKSFDIVQYQTILKTVCAFSNNFDKNDYGLIFIGVEEENNKETGDKAIPIKPIIGIPEAKIETTINQLKELVNDGHLTIKPKIDYLDCIYGDKHYILVVVYEGDDYCEITDRGIKYIKRKLEENKRKDEVKIEATAYIRVERDSIKANYIQIDALKRKFCKYSFLSDVNDTATEDDLNLAIMQEYCIRTGKNPSFQKLDRVELAERLNALSSHLKDGKRRATNYGVLMFSLNPEKYIENAYTHILIETFNGVEKVRKPYDFYGPVWVQIQKVWDIFDTFVIQESFTKPGWLNKKLKNYPQKALREAAANAIFHKRYDLYRPVEIYVTPKDVCFTNYNRPLLTTTIKDLNEKPRVRAKDYINNELKEPLFLLGFIEKEGTGLEDIKNTLLENGNPVIEYDSDGDERDFTSATIWANKEFVEQMNGTIQTSTNIEVSYDPKKLPKIQKMVYEAIARNPGLRLPAIRNICGLKDSTVDNAIKALRKKALIKYAGTKKEGGYYIC